jgi:hypothetical protein
MAMLLAIWKGQWSCGEAVVSRSPVELSAAMAVRRCCCLWRRGGGMGSGRLGLGQARCCGLNRAALSSILGIATAGGGHVAARGWAIWAVAGRILVTVKLWPSRKSLDSYAN